MLRNALSPGFLGRAARSHRLLPSPREPFEQLTCAGLTRRRRAALGSAGQDPAEAMLEDSKREGDLCTLQSFRQSA